MVKLKFKVRAKKQNDKQLDLGNIRRSPAEKIVDQLFLAITVIIVAVIAYPMYFVLIASISDPFRIYREILVIWPVSLNFNSYRRVIENQNIWLGYRNSLLYTFVGTSINLFMTTLAAYPLSKKGLLGRNFFTLVITFTMFFGGGLIPSYLVNRTLGLVDNWWVMVIPGAISAYYVIIMRTFFQVTIPSELEESAIIDGCNDIKVLLRIVLPLSAPILSVMVLFYGVGHWNSYFQALIYLNNRQLFPLQMILREILIRNNITGMGDFQMIEQMKAGDFEKRMAMIEGLKYSTVIVSTLPIIVILPMLQGFFRKGIMIGAIKG